MISFRRYLEENKRQASEIKSDEISLFVSSMNLIVMKYKRSNQHKATDIWFDHIQKGTFIDWLQKYAEPMWEKYGYPEIGKKEWGDFQHEFIKKYLVDDPTNFRTKA